MEKPGPLKLTLELQNVTDGDPEDLDTLVLTGEEDKARSCSSLSKSGDKSVSEDESIAEVVVESDKCVVSYKIENLLEKVKDKIQTSQLGEIEYIKILVK